MLPFIHEYLLVDAPEPLDFKKPMRFHRVEARVVFSCTLSATGGGS